MEQAAVRGGGLYGRALGDERTGGPGMKGDATVRHQSRKMGGVLQTHGTRSTSAWGVLQRVASPPPPHPRIAPARGLT